MKRKSDEILPKICVTESLKSTPNVILFQELFLLTEIVKAVRVLNSKDFRMEISSSSLQILQTHSVSIFYKL